MNEIIEKLIEFVETASPTVWGVLIKQVYVEAYADIMWGVFIAFVVFLIIKLPPKFKAARDNDNSSDWEFPLYGSYASLCVLVPIAFAMFVSAITRLINPEFYAIRYILQQISGQ